MTNSTLPSTFDISPTPPTPFTSLLTSLIAHETTHHQLLNGLMTTPSQQIPSWKSSPSATRSSCTGPTSAAASLLVMVSPTPSRPPLAERRRGGAVFVTRPSPAQIDHSFLKCPEFVIGDVRVDEQRHILFATEQQLSILRKARRWYLDGTFKIRRDPFQQLYSVQAFLQKEDLCKQVPLAFILMSSRRTQDYDAVFRKLKECLGDPAVEGFVMDFESACWSVIHSVFPGTELKGCSFHWTQAVLRKVGNLVV